MFEFNRADVAVQMAQSPNYKIVKDHGWLYVYPADTDFKQLADNPGMMVWDTMAVIRIDDQGRVRGNRFGKTTSGVSSL